MNILGYTIRQEYPDFPVTQKIVINTINPHSYCMAKRDVVFRKALQSSDFLIPDGIGIVYSARLLTGERIHRIVGADMHQYLINQAQMHRLKVFYMGASQDTLKKIEKRLNLEYPAIRYQCYSPPFKITFSEEENSQICDAINSFQPDILFIGMTAPKQEKWVYENQDSLETKVICSIGAVFDFFAGTAKRAPVWMQKIGLEWVHRSLQSPARLGKRNLFSNPEFVWDVLITKLKGSIK
jgi:N-acetylglucosaminyldiphosphoundecaprenol N-acetyl-beta-D-mannosaminyltransferase